MPCWTIIDPVCKAAGAVGNWVGHQVGGAASAIAGDFLGTLANGLRDSLTWLFTQSSSWWLKLPSPDLAKESAIAAIQQWLLPVTAAVATGGMIAAGMRMVLTRKHTPLLDAGAGIAAIAATATAGVLVPNLLMKAGDAWSGWILQTATHGALTTEMSTMMQMSTLPSVVVIVFGIFALILGAIQAALLVFRQTAVIILAAVLPLAAAGVTAPLTRTWMRKITSWMLALIMYKPAAAAVYAAAFTMIGNGSDLRTMLMGFVMLGLSLLAMPVLMRFFTWATGSISSGSGGSGFLGTAAAGAVTLGAMRGASGAIGGTSASEHASLLSSAQRPATAGGTGASASASSTGSADTDSSPAASGSNPAVPGTSDAAPSASASASPAGGATAGVATAVTGGALATALLAAGAVASGARTTAASANEESERR